MSKLTQTMIDRSRKLRGQHADTLVYDTQRTACVEARGFEVLRFWDNDVSLEIDSVTQAIWNALHNKQPPPACPSP